MVEELRICTRGVTSLFQKTLQITEPWYLKHAYLLDLNFLLKQELDREQIYTTLSIDVKNLLR